MSVPLLEVELSAGYGKLTTVHQASFALQCGERVGVVGTSGAGKSTLVLALMGLLPWCKGWTKGRIQLNGRDLLRCSERELRAIRGRQVALVPQSPAAALNPALSLQTHFNELWRAHARPGPDQTARMHHLLARLELPVDSNFLKRRPSQISIGQAQRVVLALALLHKPALLIADEPTSALDICTQQEIIKLLHEISQENVTTLLYVSHDLVSVLQLCDRMLVVSHGRIAESVDLCASNLMPMHEVTRDLLKTLPAPADLIRQRSSTRISSSPYSQKHVPECSVRAI